MSNPFLELSERLERIEMLLMGKTVLPFAETPQSSTKNYVYGIDGLAKLLNCSKPTAQRHKDSGKIPFSQVGRKLVFETDAVLAAIGKGGRK